MPHINVMNLWNYLQIVLDVFGQTIGLENCWKSCLSPLLACQWCSPLDKQTKTVSYSTVLYLLQQQICSILTRPHIHHARSR